MIRRWPLPRVTRILGVLWANDGVVGERFGARQLSVRPGAGFGAHAWLDVCDTTIGASSGFHSLDASTGSAA
jgi:hypothetical protein